MKTLKTIRKKFRYGEKGFTLVEMLIVVAILGVLAAVAVPNVGKFLSTGKQQAWETEEHSVAMAAMALMVDSGSGKIDNPTVAATSDMSSITSTAPDGVTVLSLADYMTGLNTDGTVKSGCTYDVGATGNVTRHDP